MKVLITGGAGYIGSHTSLVLLAAGFDVVVFDNFSNSHIKACERVRELAGEQGRSLTVEQGDVRRAADLDSCLAKHRVDAVIHFAGLKAVGESVLEPERYYDNNVNGTLQLLAAMRRHQLFRLVFSSSSTVYGEPESLPITESARLQPQSPYGRTKLFVEQILRDVAAAEPRWKVALLRYFNPVGAHESGRIGEDPQGVPNNLMPFIMQVAVGKRAQVAVHGNDYPTRDGTGVRDYIHVMDLAEGHVAALKQIESISSSLVLNLGTGQGYSVLEVLRACEAAVGKKIPFVVGPRRSGDVAEVYSDPGLAQRVLGWKASRGLQAMCVDAWRWQQNHPAGYADT